MSKDQCHLLRLYNEVYVSDVNSPNGYYDVLLRLHVKTAEGLKEAAQPYYVGIVNLHNTSDFQREALRMIGKIGYKSAGTWSSAYSPDAKSMSFKMPITPDLKFHFDRLR